MVSAVGESQLCDAERPLLPLHRHLAAAAGDIIWSQNLFVVI